MSHRDFLVEEKNINNGIQRIYKFPNGYGASVVKGPYTYGGGKGLWEVAVLKGEELCYDTPITNDVLGHLNDPEMDRVLKNIFLLGGDDA